MARQVLPWVGAVVGNFIAPGVGAQWGFAIGSLVGNVVDPMVLKGPSIGDGQTQNSQEGVPINRVYGTACVGGNVIARGDLKKVIKKSRQGKGGPVQEEERFLLTYAIGITHHQIGGILRIWENEKLVYDVRPEGSQMSAEENMRFAEKFRLFLGTPDQQPSADLEMIFGAGDTPAYSNRSYIVFPENDVTQWGGAVPMYRFEVTTSDVVLSPSLFIGSGGYRQFSGVPGTYMLQGQTSGTNRSYFPREVCTTSDGQWLIDISRANEIQVWRRDDVAGTFVSHQIIPWNFWPNISASTRCCIRFSKNQRWLVLYWIPNGGTNFQLTSLAFDPDTGLIDPTPKHEVQVTQSYVSAPGPLRTEIRYGLTLLFSPSGKYFSIYFGYQDPTSRDSLALIEFNDTLGEFGAVNSKCKACVKTIGSLHIWGCWAGDGWFLTCDNSHSTVIAYNIWGTLADCETDPDGPNAFWGVRSTLSVPGTGYIHSYMLDSTICFASQKEGQRNVFFIPKVSPTNPGTSFPWAYFDFVTGLFGGLNYSMIPVNARPNGGSIKVHSVAITGGGSYLASYTNPTDNPHASDVMLAVYRHNPITDAFELMQELTRGEIVATGVSPYLNGANSFLAFSGSQFFATVTGKAYLANIIRDVADLCEPGLDDKMDVSELEGKIVDGFVIGQQYTAKNVISSLQNAHFFDPTEYDEKVHFIVRGKAVSHVITEQDLVDEDPWSQLRRSSIEYPKTLNLVYQNATAGYDNAMARSIRSSSSVQVSGEKTIETPEVMDTDRAAQVADVQMKIAWAEAAGTFSFTVPASWHDTWVPSDVVGLYLGETPYRLRIEKIDRADGELKIEAAIDRQSAYSSFVSGIPVRAPTPPPPTIAGDMKGVYLNIPALVDSHDVLGYYYATSGTRSAYTGGIVERRVAGVDDDWSTILSTGAGRTIAQLLSPISASSEHYVDTTNVLHIKVWGDDVEAFQSLSNDAFLRERNALAIVNGSGQAELVQYRDVELVQPGEYRLTHLLRGRLATTPRAFSTGASVVVLDDVHLVVVDGSEIGTTFEHRPTAYGENPLDSPVSNDSFAQPLMQTEFPVDLLEAELTGSVVDVTWSPRERFGSDINPIRSVNWQGYRVTYTDGSTTETFETDEPEHTHDLAAYSGTVTITVEQLNRLTGPGPGVSIQVVI